MDADQLRFDRLRSLTEIHGQIVAAGRRVHAVACCTFWHSVLGVDAGGRATTPILHVFDTAPPTRQRARRAHRSRRAARAHGCVLHPSYLPAKLLWLSKSKPDAFVRRRAGCPSANIFF